METENRNVSEDPMGGSAGSSSKDARNMAMLCHLTALAGFIGIPLGNIFGPLLVWLLKRAEYPEVDHAGREALNFQISMTIYGLVCIPLIFLLIGIPLIIALGILDIVLLIIASIKTNSGETYRYPLTIRFIK